MRILKRAYKSIVSQPIKSAILMLTTVILGVVICVTILTFYSLSNTIKIIEKNIGMETNVIINASSYGQALITQPDLQLTSLDYNVVSAISTFKNVEDFSYRFEVPLKLKDDITYTFTLTGQNNLAIDEFENNEIEIVKGRYFLESDFDSYYTPVLMSSYTAQRLGFDVSNTFSLYWDIEQETLSLSDNDNTISLCYDFYIVGLFSPVTDSDNYYISSLFTPAETALQIVEEINKEELLANPNSYSFISLQPSYTLTDSASLSDFTDSATMLLPPFYKITSNYSEIASLTLPISELKESFKIFILVTIIISVAVISLLFTILIKERQKEIGILLALGEKKIKIFYQIFLELFLVSVISFTISLSIGSLIANDISNDFIKDEISNRYESSSSVEMEISDISAYYKVSIDSQTISIFYGAGVITAIFSTLLPIGYILRLKPKKILL